MDALKFIAKVAISLLFLAILYQFALNGRYHFIENGPYAIDKWHNTVSKPKNWDKFIKEVNQENEVQPPQDSTVSAEDDYEE